MDVEMVIKIPKKYLDQMKAGEFCDVDDLCKRILEGIKLPKDYGDLIDVNKLRDSLLHNWHGNSKYLLPYKDRNGYRIREQEVQNVILNMKPVIPGMKKQESLMSEEMTEDNRDDREDR